MDIKYYGRVARCHQYCEELASKIAETLAEKCKDPVLRNIARMVSSDSKKHSILLSDLADLYGVENFNIQDCSRYSGAAYGLYGYLKELEDKLDEINDDLHIKDTLETLIDMLTSIGMTDRTIVADGLENRLKNYFMEVLIQIEDDEFRHLSLIRDYVDKYL